ncbi:MAG: Ku protein [Alphaproteobacteria bacterium]|nr:MAG: Ku protein [Alphaproteobacteria bacterium]
MAAARPSWQGHLRLSLVTCPVAMYNAISPRGDVHFNLINPDTGNRIRMITVDAGTEKPVERKNLVKGFEISKGEYVTVTPEEIDSVRLESTKTIDIDEFVPAEDIDRLYWDHPYFLVPDGKMAAEPFAVIREAMEKTGKVALGRVVMSQRERLLALEPRDHGLIATTLRSTDEVRDIKKAFSDIPAVRPARDMISIAEKIMGQKEADFDPDRFQDRYENALRKLIHEKQKGHEIVHADDPEPTNVVDLMEALQNSLKGAKGGTKGSKHRPAAKSSSAKARPAAKRASAPRKTAKKKTVKKRA